MQLDPNCLAGLLNTVRCFPVAVKCLHDPSVQCIVFFSDFFFNGVPPSSHIEACFYFVPLFLFVFCPQGPHVNEIVADNDGNFGR